MTAPAPIVFDWQGDAMLPASPFWQKRADEQFVIGERYRLAVHEEVSAKSRGHYFASLREAWLNLPDERAVQFATPEHLRKHALILTGYRHERRIACSSAEEARKVARFIAPMDEYALVSVKGDVVIVATAKSQSAREMGQAQFQKSKQDALEYVWSLVGLTPEEGAKNVGKAA